MKRLAQENDLSFSSPSLSLEPINIKILEFFRSASSTNAERVIFTFIALKSKGAPLECSIDEIVANTVLCRRTVESALKHLREAGLIKSERQSRKPSIYQVIL
jgi:DNA-binding transcriptional ArsR family regulator